MTVFLVLVVAGALLLVGIAKAVNRQRPPDPWRDGDTVALDGQYVRDPRLGEVR